MRGDLRWALNTAEFLFDEISVHDALWVPYVVYLRFSVYFLWMHGGLCLLLSPLSLMSRY